MEENATAKFVNIKVKEVTLKKIWIDDNNSKEVRPSNIEGYLKYEYKSEITELKTEEGKWLHLNERGCSWECV